MIQQKYVLPNLRSFILIGAVGTWLVGILLDSIVPLPLFALLSGAGAALLFLFLLRHDAQGRLGMLLIFCVLLGAARYTLSSPGNDPQAISASIGSRVDVQGTVSDEPKIEGRSRVLTITVNSVGTSRNSAWQNADGQVTVRLPGTLIEDPYGANYGDSVELQGKLQTPQPDSSPSIFASMAFPRISVIGSGGNPIIAFLYHLRVLLSTLITQSLPQPEAALLIAILLSLRTPALKPLIAAFNVTGCAHLIAPSGFKVTILAGIIGTSTQWLSATSRQPTTQKKPLLPAQKRGGWRSWLATMLIVACISVYTLLSGAGPAALRAGIMGILLVIAPRLGRTYNVYTAFALAALLMSMLDPFVLWDVGFQLSFLGTLGIVLLTPFFQRLLSPVERLPFGHHIVEIFAVTLAAQTATLPIFAVSFQQISFIAPLTNVLTVPLLGVLLMLGVFLCGTGLLYAPLALLIGGIVWPLLRYMLAVVTWSAALPGAYMIAPNVNSGVAWSYYALLALVCYSFWHKGYFLTPQAQTRRQHSFLSSFSRRTQRILQGGAILLLLMTTGATTFVMQPAGRLTITFLNVGPAGQPPQGEAIFIRTPDGKTALIDGGLDATTLGQALDSRLPAWQRSLDLVLLTSTRTDHLAGLQDVVTRYTIGEVLDAGMLHPTTTYALWRRTISERNIHYMQVARGMTITLGTQVALQVLWPSSQLHKGSDEARDNALIVRLVSPGLHILLVGAAAASTHALSGLLATVPPGDLQAEIVQVMGDASKPFSPELEAVLQQAHPSLLVITPAAVRSRQRKRSITSVIAAPTLPASSTIRKVIQTAQAGTLEISSDSNGWESNTT